MQSGTVKVLCTCFAFSGAALALALALASCTTVTQIRRPNGQREYLVPCGAGAGWNVCYSKANDLCPGGYYTASEHGGLNRKELKIICPRASAAPPTTKQ